MRKSRNFYIFIAVSVFIALFLGMTRVYALSRNDNKLPDEIISAFLASPNNVTIYTIEPEKGEKENFHDYKVLGKAKLDPNESAVAIDEVKRSLANWDSGVAGCFEPHHGLSAKIGEHTYDLVICYVCQGLAVYEDGKFLKPFLYFSGGSPQLLNQISSKYGLPESTYLIRQEELKKKSEDADAHWLSIMPQSIRPIWNDSMRGYSPFSSNSNLEPMREALQNEFPDKEQQILTLFAWYGSGTGLWSGFPAYELVPANLLQDFSYSDLLAVAQSDHLTQPQLEGAARYFAGYYVDEKDRHDRHALMEGIKKHRQEIDHWLGVMPSSMRPLWKDEMWYYNGGYQLNITDNKLMMDALSQEFPDRNQRILALINWYGSGPGVKWNVYGYENIVEKLLYNFSTAELADALQSGELDETKLDGATRLFANWEYPRERPNELKTLPPSLKAALLTHIKKSGNKFWERYSAQFE